MKKISNEIISKVLNENSVDIIKTAEELEKMLDEELSKPEKEIDFELVHQLSIAVNETTGNKMSDIDVNQKLIEFKAMQTNVIKHFHMPKWCTGLIAACLILVCGNIYSVSAYNKNIFSLMVEINDEDFVVVFNPNEREEQEIILPTSEDDPYGIIAECAKYNIYPDTPTYIPEGFKLIDINTEIGEVWTTIMFHYKKDDMLITLSYDYFYNSKDIINMGIPSDHFNIEEIDINGVKGITSYEDDQYTLTYYKNNIVYLITLFYFDSFEEVQKVVDSLVPQNSINCTKK